MRRRMECIDASFACDDPAQPDCEDGSDERPVNQNCPLSVKLSIVRRDVCLDVSEMPITVKQRSVALTPIHNVLHKMVSAFAFSAAECATIPGDFGVADMRAVADLLCGPDTMFWNDDCGCGCRPRIRQSSQLSTDAADTSILTAQDWNVALECGIVQIPVVIRFILAMHDSTGQTSHAPEFDTGAPAKKAQRYCS